MQVIPRVALSAVETFSRTSMTETWHAKGCIPLSSEFSHQSESVESRRILPCHTVPWFQGGYPLFRVNVRGTLGPGLVL